MQVRLALTANIIESGAECTVEAAIGYIDHSKTDVDAGISLAAQMVLAR
jgi:hypothetical protein